MKFRLVKETSPEGAATWYTQMFKDDRWAYVSESLFMSQNAAEEFYRRMVANDGVKSPVVEVIQESHPDRNPLITVQHTLELNFEVSYRINHERPAEDPPEVYDLKITGPVHDELYRRIYDSLDAEISENAWDDEVKSGLQVLL